MPDETVFLLGEIAMLPKFLKARLQSPRRLGIGFLIAAAALPFAFISCASEQPPPPPAPEPIVYATPPDAPPPDEWNIFPDPTTGQVDVYHKGGYVGSVTGNEPADQDPPIPHPVPSPSEDTSP